MFVADYFVWVINSKFEFLSFVDQHCKLIMKCAKIKENSFNSKNMMQVGDWWNNYMVSGFISNLFKQISVSKTHHCLFVWIWQNAVDSNLAMSNVCHVKPQVLGSLVLRSKPAPRVILARILLQDRNNVDHRSQKKLRNMFKYHHVSCRSKLV